MEKNNPPVAILCGGSGTRLREETEFKPKPLVEIGGLPILLHIMKTYSHYGFKDFILCLGYKGEMIKEFFMNYWRASLFKIRHSQGQRFNRNSFMQKPALKDFVNGGFFVFNREIFSHLRQGEMLEVILDELVAAKQLSIYKYEGFWRSMDTFIRTSRT